MYERFTDRARKVFQLANQEAQRLNHEYIGTEHILLGLIKEGSGVAAHVLKTLDLDLRKMRLEIEKLVKCGPDMITMGKMPQTPRTKMIVEEAMIAARKRHHNHVGTEHILIGLLRVKEGNAFVVLDNLGLTEDIVSDVDMLLGINQPESKKAENLQDQIIGMKKSTNDQHREFLLQIANALSVYVVDADSKKALESISQIAKDALTG